MKLCILLAALCVAIPACYAGSLADIAMKHMFTLHQTTKRTCNPPIFETDMDLAKCEKLCDPKLHCYVAFYVDKKCYVFLQGKASRPLPFKATACKGCNVFSKFCPKMF